MKGWQCVQAGHHKNIGETIEKWRKNGWRLHTYVCARNAPTTMGTVHYLLFEKWE